MYTSKTNQQTVRDVLYILKYDTMSHARVLRKFNRAYDRVNRGMQSGRPTGTRR